jgi:signal transduction histidine kinase
MTVSAFARDRDGTARDAPRPAVLLGLALAGLGAAACVIVLRLTSDHAGEEPGLQAALLDWVVLSYVFSGLVAWWRRPESRFGPLMVFAGFLTSLSCLSSASAPVPFTIGQTVDLLPFAVFLHVFVAFPTGRIERRRDRLLVRATYVVALGGELVVLMLGGINPDNVVAIFAEPDAAAASFKWVLVALAALALAGICVLVARRRAEGPPLRRSAALLVDSFSLALVMIAALLLMGAFFSEPKAFVHVQRATFFVLGLAPLAFLVALLDARLARSSVADLMVELAADPAPADLSEPLAAALHDPSLEIAYWLPQYRNWTDQEGRPVELPAPAGGRAITMIDREGDHVAALVHDPALAEDPDLLDAVRAAAGISLENGQLHAELKARLEELQGSRGRVIEAGQRERQRLERNLHDGAQQRLIALSLELGLLAGRMQHDPVAQGDITDARQEIAISLDELRDVARGLHPAVLSGHGLEVALESLAATSAVPVTLTVELDGRVSESIEVAAYYVVSESLANVGKHARADAATIAVSRQNGDLVVEVVDDGIGGADTEAGSGLRGLADRVEALDGRLRVWTPRGGGTRVRAEMPCA